MDTFIRLTVIGDTAIHTENKHVLNITEIIANNVRLPSGYVEGELDLDVLVKKRSQKQVLARFQALK